MRPPHTIVAAVVVMSLAAASDTWAQHEGHQLSAPTSQAARNPDCAQAGQKALAIVEAAGMRLETAGSPKSGADLQVTVAQAQLAVAAAQAELFTCRAAVPAASAGSTPPAAMAGMDHSTINMGTPASGAKPAAPGAKPADSMAGMDHSKMNMAPPASGARPSPSRAKAADSMAGMDHSKMTMGAATPKPGSGPMPAGEGKLPVTMAERIADPACPGNVGEATAAKAVFERKVYYFCSTAARDEFRKDPAAYLKKHPR